MPLVVHFKRPAGWEASINIHYWDATPADPATTWPGIAMTAEANDWFVYTFPTARRPASSSTTAPAGRPAICGGRPMAGSTPTTRWYALNPERPAIPVIRRRRARVSTDRAADGDAGERKQRRCDLVHDRRQRALGPVSRHADSDGRALSGAVYRCGDDDRLGRRRSTRRRGRADPHLRSTPSIRMPTCSDRRWRRAIATAATRSRSRSSSP